MKKNAEELPAKKASGKGKNRVFHNGIYASAITVVAIAIAIVISLVVDAIPSKYTQFDLSAAGALTLSDTTKDILNGLDRDVTAYYLVQSGQGDTLVEKLLDRYAENSSHFSWQSVDPTVNPGFATQHNAADASANSVIVSCGDKNNVLSYETLFPGYQAYSYGYASSYDFDGENAITTAISQVTSDTESKAYYTTNHGETALPDGLITALNGQNIAAEALSLLTTEQIPADCELLIVNCPQNDFSGADGTNEILLLSDYLAGGGKLMLLTDPQYDTPNIDALMANYGMSRVQGIVLENDANYYLPDSYSSNYLSLTGVVCALPTLNTYGESGIADGLASGGNSFLSPLSQGIQIAESLPSNITAESILSTSETAYSKIAGYELQTIEKEEGDIDGPFDLAVWADDTATGAEITWFGSGYFADSTVDAIVNGGNGKLLLACAAEMTDQNSETLVAAKSLEADTLTVNAGTVKLWGTVFLVVIPLALIIFGVVVAILRRRK